MILFIDNYDSYVYNIVQYVSRFRTDYEVVRNDRIHWEGIDPARVDRIIISPGPRGPLEAGLSTEIIRRLGHRLPILGICLGHQCLAHVFGMPVVRAPEVVHGRASPIHHEGGPLFNGLPSPFTAARYHSLIVAGSPPPALRINARLDDGTIMGLEHTRLPLFGLQFHPESVLTKHGRRILENFLSLSPQTWPDLGDASALMAPEHPGIVQRSAPPTLPEKHGTHPPSLPRRKNTA